MTITIILLVVAILSSWWYKNKNKNMEFFETKDNRGGGGGEYIRIVSKLSQMAIQPYEGTLDTYITANKKQPDDYFPQLWMYEKRKGLLKNVATGRYLTVSPDETKVVLAPLARHAHHQQWTIDTTTGFITSRVRIPKHKKKGKKKAPTPATPPLVLHLEGSNPKENAMVVVADQGEGAAFQWYVETVSVNIQHTVLVPGVLNGKKKHIVKENKNLEGVSQAGTYTMWVKVKSMAYKKGFLKNIFTRGKDNTPGLWIAPMENRLQVLWDKATLLTSASSKQGGGASGTFELDTWFHVGLVVDHGVHLFIDGQMSGEYDKRDAVNEGKKFELIPQQGQVMFGTNGGFDGLVSNAEFVNKTLTITEIGERMRASNPEPSCKEPQRPATKVPANLTKALDQWAISKSLRHVQKNAECPPPNMGGTTVSFLSSGSSGSSGGSISTEVNLLENQYYHVSVWALSEGGDLTLRPYYKNWRGLWKTVRTGGGKKWQQLEWSFLNNRDDNNSTLGEFGFDVMSPSNKSALFLPVVSLKVLTAPKDDTQDNVKVKEFRSNGTHSTCSIKPSKVGLNAAGGWCALKDARDEYYIEATFDKLYHIYKIHTRGRGDYPQWTTEYRIEYYDVYYNQWRRYGAIFEANSDMNTVKSNSVDILTSKIRVYVVSFQSWPALRLAFSGSIGLKDKCAEYKIKADHDLDAAARSRYLAMYNKECKKVSYSDYAKLQKTHQDTQQALKAKLEKAQLDAAACKAF